MSEGELKKAQKVARKMLAMGMPLDVISEVSELSEQEIIVLRDSQPKQ
jgi:hypothetical protein